MGMDRVNRINQEGRLNRVLQFLKRRYNRPILWTVTLFHIIVGVMLCLGLPVSQITALSFTHFISHGALGLIFLASGVGCAIGLIGEQYGHVPQATFWVLYVQQVLIMCSAFACLHFAYLGHFADGVMRPRAFIFADHLPTVLLAFSHPLGVLRLYLEHKDGLEPNDG